MYPPTFKMVRQRACSAARGIVSKGTADAPRHLRADAGDASERVSCVSAIFCRLMPMPGSGPVGRVVPCDASDSRVGRRIVARVLLRLAFVVVCIASSGPCGSALTWFIGARVRAPARVHGPCRHPRPPKTSKLCTQSASP